MIDRFLPISADGSAANLRLSGAYLEVKLHANTDAFGATVSWFDALISAQQAHMATCHPDKLPACQTRLKQLIALRNALGATGGASTGHVFD